MHTFWRVRRCFLCSNEDGTIPWYYSLSAQSITCLLYTSAVALRMDLHESCCSLNSKARKDSIVIRTSNTDKTSFSVFAFNKLRSLKINSFGNSQRENFVVKELRFEQKHNSSSNCVFTLRRKTLSYFIRGTKILDFQNTLTFHFRCLNPLYVPFTKSPYLTSIQECGDSHSLIKLNSGILLCFILRYLWNEYIVLQMI